MNQNYLIPSLFLSSCSLLPFDRESNCIRPSDAYSWETYVGLHSVPLRETPALPSPHKRLPQVEWGFKYIYQNQMAL